MAVPMVIGQRLQNGACLNGPLTKGRERFCWKPKCQICGLPLLVASVNSHLSPQTLTLMGWWVTSCLCQTFQPGGVNFLPFATLATTTSYASGKPSCSKMHDFFGCLKGGPWVISKIKTSIFLHWGYSWKENYDEYVHCWEEGCIGLYNVQCTSPKTERFIKLEKMYILHTFKMFNPIYPDSTQYTEILSSLIIHFGSFH